MNDNQIEIHYFLPEGVHSADAYKLVEAETEFISIIKEIALTFDVKFKLEVQALTEGGIKQIWNAIGDNAPQISLILSIVAIVIVLQPKGDEELIRLQKEESQLQIQLLKKELAVIETSPEPVKINRAAEELSSTLKIVRRRSNFYKALYDEEKISSVSYSVFAKNIPIKKPTYVDRNEFPQYIALSGELPAEVDEDAIIGIISPVLKKGRFKWKGEYNGTFIEFWIQDKKFKESVLRKEVEFHSGTAINCVMEIKIKVDEIGDISNAGYYVKIVKSILDEDYEFITKSGRKLEAEKNYNKIQMNLFK
jgi:hypothetical protein